MRSQILDNLYPKLTQLDISPPKFEFPTVPSQEAAYALVKHSSFFLSRRHISSLANFKNPALNTPQSLSDDLLRPGEHEYQNQFDFVLNSGVLRGSDFSSFREYKVLNESDDKTYSFLDLVIRYNIVNHLSL
jgi:hypothetical protein